MPAADRFSPAGSFRHRVTVLRRNASTANELGEAVPSPKAACTLWARVVPLTAAERLNADQQYQDVTHQVRLRYPGGGVTHADQLRYADPVAGDRTLNIQGIYDIEERRVELVLMCREVQ